MKMKLYQGVLSVVVAATVLVGCGSPSVAPETEKQEETTGSEVEKKTEDKEETKDFSYIGIWSAAQVEVDGATLTIDEAEAMGEIYFTDLHIVFKDGGKAVVIEDGYNDIVDWSENNGWLRIGDDNAQYEDGKIVMDYYSDKIYFEKQSDSQDVTDVVMRDSSDMEVILEPDNEYVTVTDMDASVLEIDGGMVSGEMPYTIHITQKYIDTYAKYDSIKIQFSFYDANGNLLEENSTNTYLQYDREYSKEETAYIGILTDKDVAEVKVDKIVVSR